MTPIGADRYSIPLQMWDAAASTLDHVESLPELLDVLAESEEQHVQKGIAWLEEQGADDWAEKIIAAASQSEFNMAGSCSCAVGVALGSFGEFLKRSYRAKEPLFDRSLAQWTDERKIDAVRHGFYSPYVWDSNVQESYDRYDSLERLWLDAARQHAAWRDDVLR